VEIYKHKQSGKHFIYIHETNKVKALFVTPQAEIKSLEWKFFEKIPDQKLKTLLMRGVISSDQANVFRRYIKNRDGDTFQHLCDSDSYDEVNVLCSHCYNAESPKIMLSLSIGSYCYECATNIIDDEDGVYCSGCKAVLIAKPKINFNNELLCYKCAKQEISLIEKEKKEAFRRYHEIKASFDKSHSDWYQRRKAYAGTNPTLIYTLALLFSIMIYLIASFNMLKGGASSAIPGVEYADSSSTGNNGIVSD
jgi:hypothetical protein